MPFKKNRSLFVTTAVVFLIIIFFNEILQFFSDYLWFNSSGYKGIFVFNLTSSWMFALICSAIAFVLLGINFYIALSNYKKIPQIISSGVIKLPGRNKTAITYSVLVFIIAISFIAGKNAAGQWLVYLKAAASVPFNAVDPVFGKDISFYVFQLPFIGFLVSFIFWVLIAAFLITAAIYFFSDGLESVPPNFELPFAPKMHLVLLIIFLILIQAVNIWLMRYSLLYNENGMLAGALFADIYGRLPFYNLFIASMFIGAGWVFADLKSGCWKHTSAVLASLFIIFFSGNTVYPMLLQKLYVTPNELTTEKPFIERNIKYTRQAFGLDNFKVRNYSDKGLINASILKENDNTINNVRLWDYEPFLQAISELQEIRTYYKFSDVDVDRYRVNADYRQTMISARELSESLIPGRKWINSTFIYTHGYGCCFSPVNEVTSDGLPEFFIQDIPSVFKSDIKLTRPEIYFGELTDRYCIVNSNVKEFDYPSGDKNVYTNYKGNAGVYIDSFWKRLLFSAYFHEIKILLSSEINSKSRILYNRQIKNILSKITPYIVYDEDPYLVISQGRLFWIADGYTVSDKYPYSQSFAGMNYARNSVKAVIDAYDGTSDFYISDPSDAVIKCYSRIYKNFFKDISQMPPDLKSHIRYPEGLFKLQSTAYSIYHMNDVQVFYNQEDRWKISVESTKNNARGWDERYPKNSELSLSSSWRFEGMDPYYLILRLPEGAEEEFVLITPFSPLRKSNMIAIMTARCDGEKYGEVIVYTLPKDKLIYGPEQINSIIDQDPEISKQLTLWGQGGSAVIRGNLMTIPMADSIIYIEPIYLAAQKGKIPQLKKIIVVYGNKIAMEDTLVQALSKVFSSTGSSALTNQNNVSSDLPAPSQDLLTLINKADTLYTESQNSLKSGDWSSYGEYQKELGKVIEMLKLKMNK